MEAITKDGVSLRLAGNISSVKELDMALKYGAEGVGLFRTEFLYMDRHSFPTEEEQFEVYKLVAEKVGSNTVVIRTLDIGETSIWIISSFLTSRTHSWATVPSGSVSTAKICSKHS